MTAIYQENDDGSIEFKSERRSWNVDIPAYVYDIWLPLLGSDAVGVYGVYCRLERAGKVNGMTLRKLAEKCRIGWKKLTDINDMLTDCRFIRVEKPQGLNKRTHKSTVFTVLDPPMKVESWHIAMYGSKGLNWEYEPLTPWLTELKPESPLMTPNGVAIMTPNGVANLLIPLIDPLKEVPRISRDEISIQSSEEFVEESPASDEPSPEPPITPIAPPPSSPPSAKNLSSSGFEPIQTVHGGGEVEELQGIFLVIANAAASGKLTDKQSETLRSPVMAVVDNIAKPFPSPTELYDTDAVFQKFVVFAIEQQKTYVQPGRKPSAKTIIKHIVGFNWKKVGWLAWEAANRSKHHDYGDGFEIGKVGT